MTKTKITLNGGSYYDDVIEDTVFFSVEHNPSGDYEFPKGGHTIWITTSDSCGLRETLSGNTHFKHNGLRSDAPRKTPITVKELIKELLNIS